MLTLTASATSGVEGYRIYFSTCHFDEEDCDSDEDPQGFTVSQGASSPWEADASGVTTTLSSLLLGGSDDDSASSDDDSATSDDDSVSDDDTASTDTLSVTISPLDNGVRYWFAVAAVLSGEESEWTASVDATPGTQGGWGALSGVEETDCGCHLDGARSPLWAGSPLLLLFLVGLVRRRPSLPALIRRDLP